MRNTIGDILCAVMMLGALILPDLIIEPALKKAFENCPPLWIFIIAIMFFAFGGCLTKIFGILLIPVGIVTLIIWLII